MGLSISGNAGSGMGGPVLTSLLTGFVSWQVGMGDRRAQRRRHPLLPALAPRLPPF